MAVLFWNIKGNNDVSECLKDLTSNPDINILFLIESKLNPSDVLLTLNEQNASYYYCPSEININANIQIFTKFSSDLLTSIKDFSKRYTARKLTIPSKDFMSEDFRPYAYAHTRGNL